MSPRPQRESGADDFGKRLRELRKSRGWTQAQLAQKIEVERAVIGNYELGLHYPTIPALMKLAGILDVSADRLLGLRDNQPPEIQDRRLYQLFIEADRADFSTQGVIKQVVDSLLTTSQIRDRRTGTNG